ncbi:MAG: FAD-dependent monooxygenase [Alphaproteobacteria bacterium]|nr:FAD-dependent monooxygenase [Alphaproteobacteria bacterium]
MTRQAFDVFVSGGGIAGLVAAAGLADAGLSVCLADPAPPPAKADADGSDLRSTAYLQPSRRLLDRLGLWRSLEGSATPLEALRIIDTVGSPPRERAARLFQASDLGEDPFGWNIPNWLARKVLTERLAEDPRVNLRLGTGFASMLTREREAIVSLSDGARLTARLVVGADGRASPVREAAGIGVHTARYGQKALAFIVTHPHAHDNVSTEIYNAGGAFTLVPLADIAGGPASAVVWMNDGARAVDLAAMGSPAFEAAMTERSCGLLGHLTLSSPRRLWPIVTQRADALTAERTVLVAEAAHVLPPIGAQGLNTSLADIEALLDLVQTARHDLGSRAMLERYVRARRTDIHARAAVIDLFNRLCKSDEPSVQAIRLAGLKAVHDLAPVRKAVMRAGLGG